MEGQDVGERCVNVDDAQSASAPHPGGILGEVM